MKIAEKTYVAIDYTLTLDSGEEVDRSEPGSPLGFVVGAGQIIPGLEEALLGAEAGHKAVVVVEPEAAYGEIDPDLFKRIPLSAFPEGVTVKEGMVFEADGSGGPAAFRVDSVDDDAVMADFNHPLAGERLHFDLSVVEVREATEEDEEGGCGCDCGGGCC
jgi:FKBP-type peptidyl-prolyl cis-trans isomerase SlyD